MSTMKRGLVHSGGGRKGAFGVGVVKALTRQAEREWDVLQGTSVGAINLSRMAMAPYGEVRYAVAELEDMWLGLTTRDVWRSWFWGPLAGLWRESFFDSRPLWRLLEEQLDEEQIMLSGRFLCVGCVDYGTGAYFEASPRRARALGVPWWRYVAASSSYPGALCPVELPEGRLCGDGGAVNATPLKSAIDAGCEVIDVILTDPMPAKPFPVKDNFFGTKVNALGVTLRTIDLLAHAAMVRDVERCLSVNREVREGSDKAHRQVKLNVFCPKDYLTKNPLESLNFDPNRSRELIRLGEDVVANQLSSLS